MKQLMLNEKQRLDAQISDIEQELCTLPPGTLYIAQNGRYTKWYCYNNGKETFISKADTKYALALARATFLRLLLKDAIAEREAVNAYLRNAVSEKDTVTAFLNTHEEFRKIVMGDIKFNDSVQEWLSSPYPKPSQKYKGTTYKTLKGDLVKSIAEKDIADALFLHNIPYRYECGITFNNGRNYFFPDFTIMHPVTGQIYLWEHFGMAEQNYYQRNNANKVYEYLVWVIAY